MSNTIPQPFGTKRTTSKNSNARTVELTPHRITSNIRLAIDEAKLSAPDQSEWEGKELPEEDFNFMVGGRKDVDSIIIENVIFYRKGKREAILAKEGRTTDDMNAEDAEKSRLKRVAEQSKPGRLVPPDDPNYHPQRKPE